MWEEAINIQDYLLIRKIIKGDEEAFDSLVKKHYNNIYHYCFRKTGNKEIAKDLTQEVFMKLIRSIHRYRFTGKFTNFLFTIAVNTCNDFYRYYYRQKKDVYPRGDFNDQVDERANPQEHFMQEELATRVKHALDTLPSFQKDALILYYYHDLKVKDIAEIMDANLSTTKSRLKQGRDKLEEMFREDDFFEK